MQFLCCAYVYFHVVSESSSYTLSGEVHREQRDQEVKTIEKYKSVRTKSGRGCVPYFNYRALSGKSLVFWIGACFWEVVAHGGSTVRD